VFLFRHVFNLDNELDEFNIFVSADNRYRLFVNGERVSYGPSIGDPSHQRYETVDIAKQYGDKIVTIQVDSNRFVDSRTPAKKFIKAKDIANILKDAIKINKDLLEDVFYFVSDYVEVYEPEDLEGHHIEEASKFILDDEVRNLQVELGELIGVELFVKLWNKHLKKIHGTYNPSEGFWAVINTDYKVSAFS